MWLRNFNMYTEKTDTTKKRKMLTLTEQAGKNPKNLRTCKLERHCTYKRH